MAEEIKNLIEKIQKEGIKAAEDKARDIEHEAQRRAQAIILEAEKEAQNIISQAKEEVAKMEKAGRILLEQAGRDLLLSLRTEIHAMLNKLIVSEVRGAFTPDELSKIITTLIKGIGGKHQDDIIVSLKQKDLEKLEKGFLRKLQQELKKGVTLKASREISGGFTVSYDHGKTHYDFTDKGMAEYLSIYLKPQLAEILQRAASSSKKK